MKRHLILDNSDSEDEMPNAERIMGRDYESLVFDDGNYVNSSDFDAFAAKLYQTEQSNPAVAPHSCSHCEKLQLDLRRCKSDTYYTPKRVEHGIAARGPGWRIDDVDICTLAEAKDAGALECVLLERLFSAAKKIAGCDISLQGEDSESKWRHSVGRKRIFLLIFVTRTEENPLIQLFFELEDEGSIAKYEIFALAG
ncbi:hypothetical protein CkaCkLH20_02520 [Colletotrichum karsti]|uniref:Uncharacterized protein n=1 Tax=Colletotrichum karsti TaxID=1095194 RepID=A0A9P6IBD2_9PEZI|nr:uncharacterized protein CkaCkLH20_02520 [Colletotrichum karsti]KAF9879709.1 hypothetical protein CkaCkLH20_02520 [Colletotrichum karsti]